MVGSPVSSSYPCSKLLRVAWREMKLRFLRRSPSFWSACCGRNRPGSHQWPSGQRKKEWQDMKRGQREKTPKAFHDCKIHKNNGTNGLMIHWCTQASMSYTCPGKPKASVACRSRCLFGGRWPSWVRLMTSYQNHVHDRLRMLYRWFRSYTSLFQAFHISMTLWCFLSMDAAITRITVWHKNYKCFDTVVSYYITLWTRLLRRV